MYRSGSVKCIWEIPVKQRDMMLRLLLLTLFSSLLLGAAGCQQAIAWLGANVYQADTQADDSGTADQFVRNGLNARPRIRVGYLPCPKLSTAFLGRQDMGRHGYRPNLSEKNGLAYTCRAGHIDISHVRKAADWTAFLAAKTYRQIMQNEIEYSFKMYEPSLYFVRLTYPENWKDMSTEQKEYIAYDVSINLGRYLAFSGLTWHEIITWFGFKSKGLEPEHPSAFTWEDTFSNLFGTHVAVLALQDAKHTFNEAMTLALDTELQKLNVQPGHVSRRAAESVRGSWFTRNFFSTVMKKRNFDLGLDDGFITPSLIPSVSECQGAEAQPYPVPDLEFISEYGFSVRFEIEPKIWEGNAILNVAYPDGRRGKKRIEPVIHLTPIMDYIKKDAKKRYGPDVDLSNQAG